MAAKNDNVTITTAVDPMHSDDSPTRNRREAPPKGLDVSPQGNKLGVPVSERQDFPSPSAAPDSQRIFDANAVAEDKGLETVPGGWAEGVKEQEKLQDEYAAQDEEKKGLKQKVKDLLHKD